MKSPTRLPHQTCELSTRNLREQNAEIPSEAGSGLRAEGPRGLTTLSGDEQNLFVERLFCTSARASARSNSVIRPTSTLFVSI